MSRTFVVFRAVDRFATSEWLRLSGPFEYPSWVRSVEEATRTLPRLENNLMGQLDKLMKQTARDAVDEFNRLWVNSRGGAA